jgi:SAM-dependent methyltransferase
MVMTADELHWTAARTLAHYEPQARACWDGTRDHDVSQNIDALLDHIEAPAPFTLLDFGCGPGRDLGMFKARGHRVIGLDGSPQLAALARANSGCEALEQSFLELDWPDKHFDGVLANAVLFHVPRQALPLVLRKMRLALKPGGVFFSSNPHGNGQAGWNGGRYGVFHDGTAWHGHVSAAGFVELAHCQRPANVPIEHRPWLASVWRNPRR